MKNEITQKISLNFELTYNSNLDNIIFHQYKVQFTNYLSNNFLYIKWITHTSCLGHFQAYQTINPVTTIV